LAKVYSKFISGGQIQLRLGIWQRFIPSLLVGTDAAEVGDLAEVCFKFISGHLAKVYSKFISGGQMQLSLGFWQRFIPSLFVGDRCS